MFSSEVEARERKVLLEGGSKGRKRGNLKGSGGEGRVLQHFLKAIE